MRAVFRFVAMLAALPRAALQSDAADDRIPALPLAPAFAPAMYSGYLDAGENRSLFYWLVEAECNDAPLVLWLQGGPGASSLFSLFTETGPFRIASDGTLRLAPVRWTQARASSA